MTKEELASAILGRIADWPDKALNELFEAMGEIEKAHGLHYELSPEEEADIEEGLAEAERGEFATDEEVKAVFDRYRLK